MSLEFRVKIPLGLQNACNWGLSVLIAISILIICNQSDDG